MKAPPNTSKPKVLCPRGTHLIRCVQVVDLGTQHFQAGDNGSHKIYFGFETVEAMHVFDEKKGPQPFMLQREFAWFMNASDGKTQLRMFVEQWFGKEFPSEQSANDFDFSSLLGRIAQSIVVHKSKATGGMKVVIGDVFPASPDQSAQFKAAKPHNPLVVFELANGIKSKQFLALPKFLQEKITECDELSAPRPLAEEEDGFVPPPDKEASESAHSDSNDVPF